MFKSIKEWVLSVLFPGIKDFLLAVFTQAKQEAVEALKDIAVKSVLELAQSDLSSAEKRAEVFKRIEEYAIEKGIKVKDSMINLVLEMAVQAVKGV